MTIKAHRIQFNKYFLFVLLMTLACEGPMEDDASIGSHDANIWKTVEADSIVLHPNQGLVYYLDEPFTGTAVSTYPNTQSASTIDYKNGKRHGHYIKWFENGIKSYEAQYINGKKEGPVLTWWSNGNLRSRSNYTKGIAQGIQEQWYVSGNKFKKIQLTDGHEEGIQQSWRENGKIYNNYEAKDGRIYGLKRSKLCYELENENIQYTD